MSTFLIYDVPRDQCCNGLRTVQDRAERPTRALRCHTFMHRTTTKPDAAEPVECECRISRLSRFRYLHLPSSRGQVKDLARLSLRDPEYLAVHAEAAQPTPLRLQQAGHLRSN